MNGNVMICGYKVDFCVAILSTCSLANFSPKTFSKVHIMRMRPKNPAIFAAFFCKVKAQISAAYIV